jgi:hypothetical protein
MINHHGLLSNYMKTYIIQVFFEMFAQRISTQGIYMRKAFNLNIKENFLIKRPTSKLHACQDD